MTDTQLQEIIEMDGPLHPDLYRWWEEWLAYPPKLADIEDLFASPLHPLQRKSELLEMIWLVRQTLRPKTVMEIGADKGGGVWSWLNAFDKDRLELVIACEIRGTPYTDQLQRVFPTEVVGLPVSSYAPETVRHVKTLLAGRGLDVLFIDGDKSYFDRDFYCYLPLLSPNAIVFFHDVTDEAPGAAYDRVCAYTNHTPLRIIDTTEAVLARLRRMKGEQVLNGYDAWLRHWGGRSCGVGVWLNGESK